MQWKKIMNKQKQFIIHHEVKAFEKKKFLKERSNFFQDMVSNYWAWETERKWRKKKQIQFNEIMCFILRFRNLSKNTRNICWKYSIHIFWNFKANFVIMVSELWCTLEQVLCTQWEQSLFKVASLFSYITKVCNRTVQQKEAFSLHINI